MMRLPSAGAFPSGDLRFVYIHWTAGDYTETFAAYHFCVGYDGRACFVVPTHDLRDNMRDVRLHPGQPYAAHTAGRNSHAIGVAVCGMRGAVPHDFGAFALRPDALALLCATVAKACRFYGIAIDAEHVRTHAEAAVDDGYFGCGDDERWDIARLAPRAGPLVAADAARAGADLRLRIRAS
jgi:hypothetical protein